MTQIPNVQGHPASVDAYIRHGWKLTPIPKGTKGPTSKGWNRNENTLQSAAHLPVDHGIGLCHAYSGTMALDVDHWDRADEEMQKHGISLQELYEAPDAVTIESGKPGHGKLLYAMPFGLALTSKKLIDSDGQGGKYNYLDFRCATSNGLTVQDVLPPTQHPETRQPYRWGGRGHWSRLPVIPMPLLQFWQGLIEQDSKRTVKDGTIDASWDEIREALNKIDPDINRDEWVHIGMALQWAGAQTGQEEQAYYLWDDWSSIGSKYQSQKDTVTCWRSFAADGNITIGTLFHIAKSYGWRRPVPDAADLFASVETGKHEPPVSLVDAFRPPPPEMNFDLWPKLLRDRALELGESVGGDPLVPLLAGLGTIAGALDSRTRLELMSGFRVPPVLWLATIGKPAQKKSPGSKPMMGVLKTLEAEDRPRFKDDMNKWEVQEAIHETARKAEIEWFTSGEGQLANDAAPAVPDLPDQPVPLKLLVSDITSQKLVRNAEKRPHGFLCWLDEMNSWAQKMGDSRGVDDRSTWVQAYESDSYDYDRVGAGNIWVENFAVSIYGNMQPSVLQTHLKSLTSDGLFQRFLPVILGKRRQINTPVPDALSLQGAWDQLVRQVYALPKRTYTLSPDAFNVYRAFQQWYIDFLDDEERLQSNDAYMTALGKLEGQCGRLALILHAIEAPYEQEVSGETMGCAVEIIRSYFVKALRYLYEVVAGGGESLDEWMANHIVTLSGLEETVSLRQLKHSARRQLGDRTSQQKDTLITDSMAMLEQANWVRLIDQDRRSMVWAINPLLADAHKDHREAVIRAKQRRIDENIEKTGGRAKGRPIARGYDPETMDG